MALPTYVILSILRNIERSGKLYKNFLLNDLVEKEGKSKEFGNPGSDRRTEVSKKLSSIKSYSVESYFKLTQKHGVDPGAALQKELKKLPPISLEESDGEIKEGSDEEGMCYHVTCC